MIGCGFGVEGSRSGIGDSSGVRYLLESGFPFGAARPRARETSSGIRYSMAQGTLTPMFRAFSVAKLAMPMISRAIF